MKEKLTRILIVLTFLMLNVGIAGAQQNHQYVDLGLPSGTLWATCNVGANNPWEAGDYFAWGEIESKDTYSWSNYKHGNGYDKDVSKKYNKNDNKTTLEKSDDVAYQKWGNDWYMPTYTQFQELYDNCTNEWTTNYQGKGVAGRIFKSKRNGNTFFLPAAGYRDGTSLYYVGAGAVYWSSSLYTDAQHEGRKFCFHSRDVYTNDGNYRNYGLSVRPVRR